MNSRQQPHDVRLRGQAALVREAGCGRRGGAGGARTWRRVPCRQDQVQTGSGRAGAWDAAHGWTAESAQADFVKFVAAVSTAWDDGGRSRDGTRPNHVVYLPSSRVPEGNGGNRA